MEEAAASLGASGATTFRRIILPNLMPAILSGSALAFARAVGEFGSLVLISGNIPFETQVASIFVFKQLESDNLRGAAAVSVVLLVLSVVVLLGIRLLERWGTRHEQLSARPASACAPSRWATWRCCSRSRSATSSTRRSSPGSARSGTASPRPPRSRAFWLTLTITAIAVPLNTVFGVLAALSLVRGRLGRSRFKPVFEAILDLPFAISPVVVGLALVLVYGKTGWLGDELAGAGIQIIFSLPGMVIATVFVCLPFVAREVIPVLREIGDEQEQAAATLGAARWQTFRRITLPSIRWGIAYGVVLSTARAVGEFGAVSVVSGKISGETVSLPLLVEQRYQNFDLAGAYAASALLAVLALATLLAMTLINPRKEPST